MSGSGFMEHTQRRNSIEEVARTNDREQRCDQVEFIGGGKRRSCARDRRKASTAGPLGNAADATIAAATMSLIEQTHACHRSCRLVRVPRWDGVVRLHRHVGPRCVPARCRRVAHQSHAGHDIALCVVVGPAPQHHAERRTQRLRRGRPHAGCSTRNHVT
jgi:hypothetical protein